MTWHKSNLQKTSLKSIFVSQGGYFPQSKNASLQWKPSEARTPLQRYAASMGFNKPSFTNGIKSL